MGAEGGGWGRETGGEVACEGEREGGSREGGEEVGRGGYKCECTNARLERRRGSECARSRCTRRKLGTSLSFDAIKSHFAPPMQGLHCTQDFIVPTS